MWIERSQNRDDWITELKIGNALPDSEFYLKEEEKSFAWMKFTHEKMLGVHPKDPACTFYAYQDGKSNGIAEIDFALMSTEEEILENNGYKKLERSLKDVGLGDMTVWIKEALRDTAATVENSQMLIDQLKAVNKLIRRDPKNEDLLDQRRDLQVRLERSFKVEDDAAKLKEQPILYARDFLALDNDDMSKFMDVFRELDGEEKGYIHSDAIYKKAKIERNKLTNQIFAMMKSEEGEGFMDFGEFLKAVGTYCMFNKEDLRKLAFSVYDPYNEGYILQDDLMDLLTILHPKNQGPVTRALKEVHLEENGRTRKFFFDEFLKIDTDFPYLMLGLEFYQDSIRDIVMGQQFWEEKLRKYRSIRESLLHTKMNMDKIEGAEDRRRRARIERIQRIERRKKEARETDSSMKRNLLVALNIAEKLLL